MNIHHYVKKAISFTKEEKSLIEKVVKDHFECYTFISIFENPYSMMPLLHVIAMLSGWSGEDYCGGYTFNAYGKREICDVLRDAYENTERYDQETRNKILEIMNAIWDTF